MILNFVEGNSETSVAINSDAIDMIREDEAGAAVFIALRGGKEVKVWGSYKAVKDIVGNALYPGKGQIFCPGCDNTAFPEQTNINGLCNECE